MPNELISNQGTKKAAEVLDDLAQRLRDLGECSKSMQHVGIVIPRDDMQRLARGLGDISGFVAACSTLGRLANICRLAFQLFSS
jgi:hypothetical protein